MSGRVYTVGRRMRIDATAVEVLTGFPASIGIWMLRLSYWRARAKL